MLRRNKDITTYNLMESIGCGGEVAKRFFQKHPEITDQSIQEALEKAAKALKETT
jgi:uncharacterized protein (DUF433 family)